MKMKQNVYSSEIKRLIHFHKTVLHVVICHRISRAIHM